MNWCVEKKLMPNSNLKPGEICKSSHWKNQEQLKNKKWTVTSCVVTSCVTLVLDWKTATGWQPCPIGWRQDQDGHAKLKELKADWTDWIGWLTESNDVILASAWQLWCHRKYLLLLWRKRTRNCTDDCILSPCMLAILFMQLFVLEDNIASIGLGFLLLFRLSWTLAKKFCLETSLDF